MGELAWFFSIATCVKLLLAPSYHSTDFEVHRHWLALTSSLPLSQWYSDESSPWTLDYPPLFAYFELLLSLPASLLDPTIVHLTRGQNYSTPSVVLFQRLSVAASDLSLLASAHLLTRRLGPSRRRIALALLIWSPALLIVDYVHFQYNGFLLGILLISLASLAEGRDLAGGIAFAVLICSKHLFMVAAPVYFVYLLRNYCWNGGFRRGIARFLTMGAAVGVVFAVAFGPFLYYGQDLPNGKRIASGRERGGIYYLDDGVSPTGLVVDSTGEYRLCQPFLILYDAFADSTGPLTFIPFWGLCHAYWAPNFWVFFIILDKVLAFMLAKLGFTIQMPKASFTGGLVGDSSPFAVLPRVNPIITFLLVILAMSPCIVKAFLKPQPKHIIRWVAYAYTCGFMFGWHVHEKASLHFTIPLGIIATNSLDDARHYFLLSIVSCYSLFPLLFEPQEYPIKVLLLAIHATLMWAGFSFHFSKRTVPEATKKKISKDSAEENGLIGWVGICYLLGLVGIEVWAQVLHPYIFGSRLPFLPLMLVSIYCAIGMMYSWLWQLRQIIRYT